MYEKIERVKNHLAENPADYQSVISLLKLQSKAIEHEIHLRQVEKMKRIAQCKQLLKERQNEESTLE